jgi:hypothetical protein
MQLSKQHRDNLDYGIIMNGVRRELRVLMFRLPWVLSSQISFLCENAAPGAYTFQLVSTPTLVNGELHTYNQSFLLGGIAFNTDKDVYSVGDAGTIDIGVIDPARYAILF